MKEDRSLLTRLALSGESELMRRLRMQIQIIAPHMRTALILAGVGLGEELVAEEMFRSGPQQQGALLTVRADAFNNLLAQGGETALDQLLLEARGGALHLRDVGDLAASAQRALLESIRTASSRVAFPRVLASTGRPLKGEAATGAFLPELLYRLTAVVVQLPPLAERREDLPSLIASALNEIAGQYAANPPELSREALALLVAYRWPGNLLEMENLLRHLILEGQSPVRPEQICDLLQEPAPAERHSSSEGAVTRPMLLQEVIDQHLVEVMRLCSGNKLRAAEMLGVSRSTLYRMLDSLPARTTSET